MLENIVQTEKESAEFEKYKALKGEYLYKQVSDILFELDGKPVSYSDVSSIIRYDKNLRDTLFIYLATFEELLRAELFRKYDVDSADHIYRFSAVADALLLVLFKVVSTSSSPACAPRCFALFTAASMAYT